jgi:hypothetical protein
MAGAVEHKEFFECECHSREHMVVVGVYDFDGGPPDFFMEVTSDLHLPWYRRIWPSIKYLFGQPSLSWHDVLIPPKDVKRLQGCIDTYNRLMSEAQARFDEEMEIEKNANNE